MPPVFIEEFYEIPAGTTSHVDTDDPGSSAGYFMAISGDGSTMIAGAPWDNTSVGKVFVYERTGSIWTNTDILEAIDKDGDFALFGFSVALSYDGNVAVVGGPMNGSTSWGSLTSTDGAVWVFRRSSGSWSLDAKLTEGIRDVRSAVGFSVAINASGTCIAVGEPQTSDTITALANYGAAQVYDYDGSWELAQELVVEDEDPAPAFGSSVAFATDDVLLVSGPSASDDEGAVWSWERVAGVWSISQRLSVPGSVKLGGIQLVANASRLVASSYDDGAYVWDWGGSSWSYSTNLPFSDGAGNPLGVAMNGDSTLVAIGSGVFVEDIWFMDPEKPGAVTIYQFDGSWNAIQTIVPDEAGDDTVFATAGIGFDNSGQRLVVGGAGQSSRMGAVWVYTSEPVALRVSMNIRVPLH